MDKVIKNGFYRHYKGNVYKVVNTALHTETNEKLVIYHSKNNKDFLFARPLEMFIGNTTDGKKEKRFTFEGFYDIDK